MPEPKSPISSPDPLNRDRAPEHAKSGGMFREPGAAAERSFPTAAVAIAGVAVLILLALFVAIGRRGPAGSSANPDAAGAAYASHVKLSDVEMSESTSFSGGKETYLDGKVTNAGPATVTGVRVQVTFAADGGGVPQVETVPVNLIRMRQPEIDTEPVSAEPLTPGATKEFRLIFDDVKPEWNQQVPEIRVIGVATR